MTHPDKKKVTVASPASIANLVCGFDVLGLSLNDPNDLMQIAFRDEPGIGIRHIDAYNLSCNPEQNVAGVALMAMMQELPGNLGFDIVIDKQIKPGSGLGSSAASAAGIVWAANELLDKRFSNDDLVRFAMAGEKLAYSGIEMDIGDHKVRRDGISLALGPTEFRLLRHFLEHPGRVFSRERLLDSVWGRDSDIEPRTVDVHIRRLRKAINLANQPDLIRTVRSAGYALDSEGAA